MSQSQKTTSPIAAVPAGEQEKVAEKTSIVHKVVSFARNHKKPLIAVGLLTLLVGGAAITGRSSDTRDNTPPFDLKAEDEESTETETTVA